MEVLIRVAGRDDVESLKALGAEHYEFFRSRYELQEQGLGEILVALKRAEVIGGVFISWDVADEPEVREHLADVPMIFHLHVAPKHRHQGVGRRLLRAVEENLRGRRHRQVLLGVDKSNKVARDLYEWLGYEQPGEPDLSDLGAAAEPGEPGHSLGETYDILVADLDRPAPQWPSP